MQTSQGSPSLPSPDEPTMRQDARPGRGGPAPAVAELQAAQPWSGFAEAADAVLALLQSRLGMDLWAVTRVRGGTQEVLVARSTGFPVPPGAVLPWAESLCARMVAGTAPRIAPRVRHEPGYAGAGFAGKYPVAAYIGVPLVDDAGHLFGTLCALATQEQPASLTRELALVELLARQLSTLLAKEQLAAERSAAAASAYALAERDMLTGVLNPRGWERALHAEDQRCARSGLSSAVAVVDLDHLKETNRVHGHAAGDERLMLTARVLEATSRPADHVARTGGDELAVLATDVGAEGVTGWLERLRRTLDAAGVSACVGAAARPDTGSLPQAWDAAREAVLGEQRARLLDAASG
jgi:diguanylate cyclase